MTAPDSGLTDLIAAHRWDDRRGICECMYSPEFGPGTRYERMGVKAWAAHVALVVEQHTNRRITELEAELAEVRDDKFYARVELNADMHWKARAEKAEATVAELEERIANAQSLCHDTGRYNAARTKHWNIRVFACDVLAALKGRTALEGEQQ